MVDAIQATPEHPFFVVGKGVTPAGSLCVGDALATRAGPALTVASTETKKVQVPVYNFTVADDHTYFVGTANGGTWVHNYPTDPADLVDLTDFRRIHIRNNHMSLKSGKTDFPGSWSEDGTMHNISDVASDPNSNWSVEPKYGGMRATGTRDGIDITVDFYPPTSRHFGKILTAFPTNVPVNP